MKLVLPIFLLLFLLFLVRPVLGDEERITLTSCTTGGCSTTNYNSNTSSIGATVAKNTVDTTGYADTSTCSGTIEQVIHELRHDGDAGISGTTDLTYQNVGGGTTYCTASISNSASETYTNIIPTGCSWTCARLDDLEIIITNADAQSPTNNNYLYSNVYINFTPSSNTVPYNVTPLQVNATPVPAGQTINFTLNASDLDDDDYRLTVCATDSINEAYPGTCDTGQTICTSGVTPNGTRASCANITNPTQIGANTAYGFMCDDTGACNTTSIDTTYTITYINTTSLIRYHSFQDASDTDTTIIDTTGNANSVGTDTVRDVEGLIQNRTNTPGAADGDGISFGTATDFAFSGDWAISLWMNNFTGGRNACRLVGATTSAAQRIDINLCTSGSPNGKVSFISNPTGTAATVTYDIEDSNTSWTHLVFTRNQSTIQIWRDGTLLNTTTSVDNSAYSGTDRASIAKYTTFNGHETTAQFDEIGVWDRALNDTEITGLYNSGSGCTYPFTNCPAPGGPADSCEDFEGGGTNTVDCTDACTIDANRNMAGGNFLFTGNGQVLVTGQVTNYGVGRIENQCTVRTSGTGGFLQ